jgi:hypothetical protein
LYLASLLLVAWGVAHLFPTKNVVKGFGNISLDNRRVMTMEWINEGATLIFIGVLTAAVTLVDPASAVARAVYWLAFIMTHIERHGYVYRQQPTARYRTAHDSASGVHLAATGAA